MKTLKQKHGYEIAEAIQLADTKDNDDLVCILSNVKWIKMKDVRDWLTQKPYVDTHICQEFCRLHCKLCIVDDVISRKGLLKDLEK